MSPGMSSTVTVAPGEDVLRDVRKDAARQLGCQAPGVSAELGPWAGAQGNVIAFGCGYEITYYVRCLTNHQCSFSTT